MIRKLYLLILFLFLMNADTFAQTTIPLPPQTATYAFNNVRGYYFTAPSAFTMCSVYVPTDASMAAQSVEVVRFTAGPPPAYPGTTNSFTSLFYSANFVPNTPIPCNIVINAGDVIGVYGYRGTGGTAINSYGSPNPYSTTINATPTNLYRSGMQFDLSTQQMHDIWTEASPNSTYIGRVEFTYNCCVGPSGGVVSGNSAVCPGTTQTYTVTGALNTTSYTWTVPAGTTIVSGQGTTSITVTMGTSSGQVCVTTTNACTSAAPICFDVTVDPAIIPGTVDGDDVVCSGSTHTYSLINSANATAYNWTVPAGYTILSGQGTTSISVLMGTVSGDICVTPSDSCATVTPVCKTISVTLSPVISSSFTTNTTCADNDGKITLTGLLPNVTYTVSYTDGIPVVHTLALPTDASGNIVISGLTGGIYTNIFVKSGICSSNIVGPDTVTALVVPMPPTVYDAVYCQYETAIALTATLNDPFNTLKWYTTPTGGTGTTVAPVPSTAVPGVFQWYVTEVGAVGGCESPRVVQNVYVKAKPLPPVTLHSSYVYCQGDSTAVQLTAVGDSLKWYTTPTIGGVYSFTAPTPQTNILGVYTWYVTQTTNGCESDMTAITVGIFQKPEPPVTKDLFYCQGDVAEPLTAIGNDLLWYLLPVGGSSQPTPTPITTIPDTVTWYVASNNHGCESDRTPLKVIIKYRPTAHILISNDSVCQFDNLTFQYSGNAYPTATWMWEWPVGATVKSANDSTPGPIVVQFDTTGYQSVSLVVAENGCASPRVTVPFLVEILPAAQISISSRNACNDDTIQVGVNYSNMQITNFWWDFDGGLTPYGSSGTWGADQGGPFNITWPVSGIHPLHLHMQGINKCYSNPDAIDTVFLHDRPEAKIESVSANNICSGDSIRLSASTNKPGYSYQWTPKQFFDDDDNTAVVNAYVESTGYITLRVANEYGCASVDSMQIVTKPCCDIYMPSAFSPNGDGKNDLFRIIDLGRHVLTDFRIVNRWGEIIFNTADPKQGWDGTHEGVAQDMGVYYYVVKFKCDGGTQTKTGEVTLVR